VEVRFAGWAAGILEDLTDDQIQKMLRTEFGGMNEVLVDLYADTGDKRWLDLSWRFEDRAFTLPLQRHRDILPGKHGNTQVPKLIGSADRFALTGNAGDLLAAAFFWDRVVHHHSFATGGHGKDEYFGEPDRLSDRVDGRTAETCNVYNMLKLTRRLFGLRPDAWYAEFHERALFNHILASIDPEDGRTCYMVPVGRAVLREYSDPFRSFTCCVGTGMESHALHGDGIYYESGSRLWVNLYAPSSVEWTSVGARLEVETDFPEGESVKIRWTLPEPRELTLALRRPSWAGEGFAAAVNGSRVENLSEPGTYLELKRTWKEGDTVTLVLPKKLRLEPLPDNPRRVALLWGPLVLAGDLGPERRGRRRRAPSADSDRVPVFVAADRPVEEWVKPVPGRAGHFRTDGVGRDRDVELVPFYRLHRRTYAVYWDLFTPEAWEQKKAEYAAERERIRRLEEATVAYAQPGEMQPERDFRFEASRDTWVVRVTGRPGRRTRGWFSFEMPVEPDHPMALVATYHSGERRRGSGTFRILVDGEPLAEERVEPSRPARFVDVQYAIPAERVAGKEKVTVRFEAGPGSEISGLYGLRVIRADAER
jgi:DUF1680 family protein